MKNLFEKDFPGKFSYVIIEDIAKVGYCPTNEIVTIIHTRLKEGAFDQAVQNVDAVAHTASPFHLQGSDPDQLLIPAIKGTTGILGSILKHG